MAVTHLRANAPAILAELHSTVLAQVPAFSASHDDATLSELATHDAQHLAELIRLLEGGAVDGIDTIDELGFVREHARLRAEHRFPLEAVLHGYRCNHKLLSRWLRAAAQRSTPTSDAARDMVDAMADFALEYFDATSTVASIAYVDQIHLLADVADQRTQLLDILLGGYDESDARVAAILRGAGYLDHRRGFCVVLAMAVDATEMVNMARARRLADAVDQLVPASLARRLVDVRDGQVVGVFSGVARASGWTRPSASLAQRIATTLATAGNAVLIGVSGDVASTSRVPAAHRQALLALRLTGLTRRVVPFATIPLRELMIHLAGEELQRLLPPWAGDFYQADDRLGGTLSATLRAYADADMNVLKAGLRLALHPNTVYARMNRIRDVTGLNARAYSALTDLITVADARVAVSAQR
ncbi:MAG: helix-turn-helix domain-containing protein [Rubrivivax sp.]